jgi:hypothetical protein
MLEAAEGLAVDDAVTVALEIGAEEGWPLRSLPSAAMGALSGEGREEILPLLQMSAYLLTVGHGWGRD